MMSDEENAAMTKRLYATTDASVWAHEFMEVMNRLADPDPIIIDEGTMTGWFASAIETGRNHASAMVVRPVPPEEPFEFSHEYDGTLSISSAVFQTLGAASMCWAETPSGVFDSTRAKEIGDKLLAFIDDVFQSGERVVAILVEGDGSGEALPDIDVE